MTYFKPPTPTPKHTTNNKLKSNINPPQSTTQSKHNNHTTKPIKNNKTKKISDAAAGI